jgi:cytochrome P450 family 144
MDASDKPTSTLVHRECRRDESLRQGPDHFPTPDEFRLDRADGKGHITFGKGAHFCVGAALARLEATIVLRRLLERTTASDVIDVGRWLPSLLVRRLEGLELAAGIAG